MYQTFGTLIQLGRDGRNETGARAKNQLNDDPGAISGLWTVLLDCALRGRRNCDKKKTAAKSVLGWVCPTFELNFFPYFSFLAFLFVLHKSISVLCREPEFLLSFLFPFQVSERECKNKFFRHFLSLCHFFFLRPAKQYTLCTHVNRIYAKFPPSLSPFESAHIPTENAQNTTTEAEEKNKIQKESTSKKLNVLKRRAASANENRKIGENCQRLDAATRIWINLCSVFIRSINVDRTHLLSFSNSEGKWNTQNGKCFNLVRFWNAKHFSF